MIFFFLELNLNILYYYTSVWSTVTVLDLLYRCFNSHLPYLDIVQLPDQTLLHQVHHLVLSDPLLPQSQAFVRHPGRLAGLAVGLLQLGLDLNMEVSAGQCRSVEVSAGQCRSVQVSLLYYLPRPRCVSPPPSGRARSPPPPSRTSSPLQCSRI